ncbi:putative endonuclease [Chitinivorax tropicus]|uniref:Putative endonuclease n=1 Tax=Chitinivorax tropicus TaxID=714531 RepID=A0A840MPC5_9PROT|nr:GIY-YIG nuclease family protein [Chitinivorax tropicus]MBB5017101.1 putative endonuclease [Chitinivorax tropicus]
MVADWQNHPAGQWVVYILQCVDGSLYTGVSNHLPRRIREHEQGTGARYTRGRGPLTLRYVEPVESKSQALKRERAIKQLTRSQKLALIEAGEGIDRPARHVCGESVSTG